MNMYGILKQEHVKFTDGLTWDVGSDGVFGIATCGLDGPGIKSQWRQYFLHPFVPAMGPTQPLVELVPHFFPRREVGRVWH